MNSDYRIAMLRELRDQQVRFAPRTKRIEQANRASNFLRNSTLAANIRFEFLFYR